MIAEPSATVALQNASRADSDSRPEEHMSLGSVVATLQVVLATRRAVHSEDHAYWYTIARGM
jgi:hypothetical protein